ncbi:MAG: primary-amine oxidase, partial [Acidimicrobiaceae bacterium]
MDAHPLDVLSADEIAAAVALLRTDGLAGDEVYVAQVVLDEPTKAELEAFAAGRGCERRARVTLVPGPGASVVEASVSLDTKAVLAVETVAGQRPAILFEEALYAIVAVMEHEGWQAALAKRGITDLSKVQLDPWPAGTFGSPHEDDRRITRVLAYLRDEPNANGYARPIEGVIAYVDLGRREVLEVVDMGVVPIPEEAASYLPADNEPLRADLRAIEITQPDGPSFTLDGNLLRWQRWSLRVSMDPYEGLVLHTVGYEDGGRVRSILHRASISEMVVPYGHPGPMHGWKNAFDAGEWGLGRMANSLTEGCDCLGEIRYLDATFADEHGGATTIANAICLHEEDYGILWKHQDQHAGTTEVRRSRRMVISSIATVGNYEYGFYWYLFLDGSIELDVKLTGIMSTKAIQPGAATA